MGLGAIGPGGHDRLEGRAVGPEPAHLVVEAERHLPFGHALAEQRAHGGEGLVGDARRLGHALDLAGVLDPPEPLDHALGGDEIGIGEDL